MCVACPARVLSRSDGKAEIVDALGRQRSVNCPIEAAAGDHVLIGMGYAIEKISAAQYAELAKAHAEAADAAR